MLFHRREFFMRMGKYELQNGELRVPGKFVKMYWKEISNPVFLILPNGAKQKIFWEKRNSDVWFGKNWEKFAQSLKFGYTLTFKYEGGSHFKVKIFGRSNVERDYSKIKCVDDITVTCNSHFETNKGATTSQRTNKGKRKTNMDFVATQKGSGADLGGKVKKAKKCLTAEAVKESAMNSHPDDENPGFEIKLSRSYIQGDLLRVPSWFSKKYFNELEGTATISKVGEERTWGVELKFDDVNKNFTMKAGWKSFSQEHNLKVGDACKFEMTQQRKPVSFRITITRVRDEPCPELQLQGANLGGTVKKAKKCFTTEAVKERATSSHPDENPSFTLKLSPSYIQGDLLKMPSWFSKEYLNELEGTATIKRNGDQERTWNVKLKFDASNRRSMLSNGWKSFTQENNLQVDDVCKFEMTQCEPVSFRITILRAREEPCPQQLQEGIKGISRSCQKAHDSESPNMKQNTFKVSVKSSDQQSIPNQFMKRHNICNGNWVELELGEAWWVVKVIYYHGYWWFSDGWSEFVKECKLKIGDTCLFEMIDKENLVFKVSIAEHHH